MCHPVQAFCWNELPNETNAVVLQGDSSQFTRPIGVIVHAWRDSQVPTMRFRRVQMSYECLLQSRLGHAINGLNTGCKANRSDSAYTRTHQCLPWGLDGVEMTGEGLPQSHSGDGQTLTWLTLVYMYLISILSRFNGSWVPAIMFYRVHVSYKCLQQSYNGHGYVTRRLISGYKDQRGHSTYMSRPAMRVRQGTDELWWPVME